MNQHPSATSHCEKCGADSPIRQNPRFLCDKCIADMQVKAGERGDVIVIEPADGTMIDNGDFDWFWEDEG